MPKGKQSPCGGAAPAVILGLSPTGLAAARELGRAGISVTGVASELQAGLASRYLQDCIVEPFEERRLQRLIAKFSGHKVRPVLIPTSDQDIDFIISHANLLGEHFVFQESYRDGKAAVLLTKEHFYNLCDEYGVAYPRLWTSLPAQINELKGRITYPCLIKPSRIHEIKTGLAGKKGWIAATEAEFEEVVSKIPEEAGVLLCQEIIPGPESEITLYTANFDSAGRAIQPFTAQKVRQYPPGFGSASLVRSNPEPESQQIAERLLMRFGYRGIAAAEFKRDSRDGRIKIIEMNARPSLWFSICTAAGKFVILASYHDLAGTDFGLEERPQENDVCWRYVGKDLYSQTFYRLAQGFVLPPPDTSSVKNPYKCVTAVFASDDPAPLLAEVLSIARKAFSRLFLKVRRRLGRIGHAP